VRQVCFILLWAEANGGTPAPLSLSDPSLPLGDLLPLSLALPSPRGLGDRRTLRPEGRYAAHVPLSQGAMPGGRGEAVRLSAVQDSLGAQRVALGSMS